METFKLRIDNGASPMMGVEVGDIFLAERYVVDPDTKFTLIEKLSGSTTQYYNSSMNHYQNEGTIVND